MNPIRPTEIVEQLDKIIPKMVIESVNDLLKQKYRGSKSDVVIYQEEIVERIIQKHKESVETQPDEEYYYSNGTFRRMIYDNNWLDFEKLYEKYGWKVMYDKPAYNETYKAFFTFKPIE